MADHGVRNALNPSWQELMYLLCIKRLKDEGLTIVTDLGDAAPSGLSKAAKAPGDEVDLNNSNNAMGRRMEQVRRMPGRMDREQGVCLLWGNKQGQPRQHPLNHPSQRHGARQHLSLTAPSSLPISLQLMPLVSLPVADSILGYVGATVTNSMRLLAKDTPLSIDRVQAARLYGGMLEVSGVREF